MAEHHDAGCGCGETPANADPIRPHPPVTMATLPARPNSLEILW